MNTRWRLVSRLTHLAAARLGPLMALAGRGHARLLRASGGRLGRRFFGARVVVLEVVGRRSGELRRTPLLYVADGERFALLASNAGSPRTPAWWLNLRAAGEGVAIFGTRRVPVRAREATAAEHARLFDLLVANYPPVAAYPGYTDRSFAIAVLEPLSAVSPTASAGGSRTSVGST